MSRDTTFKGIDDRSISGNPYDASKWLVKRRGEGWVVLDDVGNPIHEARTKAAATAWCRTMAAGRERGAGGEIR